MTRFSPKSLTLPALLLVGLAIGLQSARMGLAQAAVRARDGATAAYMRPQNGWGLALLAERQFKQGQTDAAIASSRAAIAQTPLAVVAVRTLAQADDRRGGAGAGQRAWRAASLLGWRDKPVQVWAALQALSNGQPEIFAMRADALLRTGDPDELMMRFIRQAVVQPGIRQAFVARLNIDPPWRIRFFQAEVPPSGRALGGVLAVLNDLKSGQSPPSRQELRDAIMGLINDKRFAEAESLDRRFVNRTPDPDSLLDDGGFDLRNSDYQLHSTPFDWSIDPRSAAVEELEGSRYIVILAAFSPDPALRRFVALPEGAYRLEFVVGGSPGASETLQFAAQCAASGSIIGRSEGPFLTGDGRNRQSFAFTVPAGCGLVQLTLRRLQPGSSDVLVDDVVLQRI